MAEIHELTALEQAAQIRAGQLSPVELVEHYLARIDAYSDRIGAFITVTGDAALAAAERAEPILRRDAAWLPPLYGLPTAIKDLNSTAGVRTTFGSATSVDFVPTVSDEVVVRLERAGLVSLGKTNTPEFGSPCYTEPDVAPPARTPYDLDRSAGGSSGGAAAAVAAGLAPFAQGSDGGGSIRIPASVCGLVGFKPSRGRVSGAPLYGDVSGLSTSGPLARTVRDAAALLDAMAGPAVGDPTWAPPPRAGETFLAACDRDPGRLRIARFREPIVAGAQVDPVCVAAYDRASAVLTELGHDVEDVEVPLEPTSVPTFEVVWAVSASSWPIAAEQQDRLRPLTRWLRARGDAVSAPDYARALVGLRQAAARAVQRLDPYDAVLTPALAQPPAPVGGLRNDDDPEADFEAQKAFTPYTSAWNVTGMPAVSLPLHMADGLPIGVMIAGRPAADAELFSLAAQVEQAVGWSSVPVELPR